MVSTKKLKKLALRPWSSPPMHKELWIEEVKKLSDLDREYMLWVLIVRSKELGIMKETKYDHFYGRRKNVKK